MVLDKDVWVNRILEDNPGMTRDQAEAQYEKMARDDRARTPSANGASAPPFMPGEGKNPLHKALLSLVPVSPAPLSGKEGIYGWGRLALYGTIAAATFAKHKRISYVAMGAAGISLASSLAAHAYTSDK